MSPTAAMNVAATITLTPGTVISRLTSGHDSASAAISRSTADLRVEEVDLADGGVDRLALGQRLLLLGQPAAALDAEQVRRRRAVLQAAHQHRVDLVLAARARAHELRPARESPAHRADPLIWRPHAVELSRPQQLRQRPRIEAIGLRPGLPDTRVARRHHDHSPHMRLDDPRDLPRIAGHLQRDQITRVKAAREHLKRLRLSLHPTARTQLAGRDHRHLAEVAMDIQTPAAGWASGRRAAGWRRRSSRRRAGGSRARRGSNIQAIVVHVRAGRARIGA
jgi:hypothetical protein